MGLIPYPASNGTAYHIIRRITLNLQTKTDKPSIIAVGGSTASGKSALALELACSLGGEIVSCDSMAVYCEMNIGTAKPSCDEMARIPHHMIDVCPPSRSFSAADWVDGAARAIDEITSRGKIPIICGGTGMYLDALLRPEPFSNANGACENATLREELRLFAESNGNEALHERLRAVDPDSAAAIHPNNLKRVIRALEIYLTTGITKTEADRQSLLGESRYNCRVITLDYESRELLYSRIDRRVDEMLEQGLECEVRTLRDSGKLPPSSTAAQGIGYKELLLYLDGELSLDTAIELVKKNTRNYAKRQLTWFKKYRDIVLVPDSGGIMKSSTELCVAARERLSQ